jgi:hypothetical protein
MNWQGVLWFCVFLWSFVIAAVAVFVAACYLVQPGFRLRSRLYLLATNCQALWRLHIDRPECGAHGYWTENDVWGGFCGKCLDQHLERTGQDIEDLFR